MATAEERSPVDIDLPILLSVEQIPFTHSDVSNEICNYLSSDTAQLNSHFQSRNIKCIIIREVFLHRGHIRVRFSIETTEDLDEFKDLVRNEKVSAAFDDFWKKICLEKRLGSISLSLRFHLNLCEEQYKQAKCLFEKRTGSSMDKKHSVSSDKKADQSPSERSTANEEAAAINLPVCQLLTKEIVFVRPESEAWRNVSDIRLIHKNGTYVMNQLTEKIWSAEMQISAMGMAEDNTFCLEADLNTCTKIGIPNIVSFKFNKQKLTVQAPYIMSESDTERILWDNVNQNASELAEHFIDILVRHSEKSTLLQCCMQIENLSKKFYLEKYKVDKIYSFLYDKINKKSEKHWLLFIVVLGNVFKSYSCAAECLKKCELVSVLKVLKCFKVSDLTSAASNYMPKLLYELCKKAHGDNYCYFMFVGASYPFLDEQYLSDRLVALVTRKIPLFPKQLDEIENDILQVFSNLYDGMISDTSMKFLNQLLLHCPTAISVKAYAYLKQTKQNVPHTILESVLGSLKSFLKSSQRTGVELANMLDVINVCTELKDETKPLFEEAFIRTIPKICDKEIEQITRVMLATQLFDSFLQQEKIIETLARVNRPDLHYLLFEIMSDPKFRAAAEQSSLKWLKLCLENAMLELKKAYTTESKLKNVYLYLSKAREQPIISANEELLEAITTYGVDFLSQFELKQVMRAAKCIEELSSSAGELFRSHVKELLNRQQRNDYHEVLLSLCGTYGDVRINSRFTAGIVCSILDLSTSGKSSSVVKGFQEVLKHYDLWMAVFKAQGTYLQTIKESPSYVLTSKYIYDMLHLFEKRNLQNGVLENLTKVRSKKEVVALLCLVTNVDKENVIQGWTYIENRFREEIDKVSSSCAVLTAIQSHISGLFVPQTIKEILVKLNELQKKIQTGQLTAREIDNKEAIWQELTNLPGFCLFLCDYVNSRLFWRSCKENVEITFKESREKLSIETRDDDYLEDIHRLFDVPNQMIIMNIDQKSHLDAVAELLLFLQILEKEGISTYKKAWHDLIRESDKDIKSVLNLIHKVSIDSEIKIAEEVLHEPIPIAIKTTLQRLTNLDRYETTIDAVRRSLDIFKIQINESDSLYQAIYAFETIKKLNDEDCSFSFVMQSLEKVNRMSTEISNDTLDVLNALGHSSSLIEFLREIIDEDIRNLIDAVDCISEQQVQESAVSALIEVKGFLHGILIKTSQGLSTHDFIASIQKQCNALSHLALQQLPSKIYECGSSLHNLKSLYGNVANRGAMTVEIINNINTRGKFSFKLTQEGECFYHAWYRHGSGKEEHLKPSLMDLRSRALLLMNTRTKSYHRKVRVDTLEKFVDYVDLAIEIAEVCEDLHQSGNIDFITFTTATDCKGLGDLCQKLLLKNENWFDMVKRMRQKYYLLNFIHGPEIHTLFNFFENKIGEEKVKSILRFIHPELKVAPLLKEYSCMKSSATEWSNENVIENIGSMLHFGYDNYQPLQRPFKCKLQAKRLTDVVQNKRLFVAALEENSNQVIKTLLALYLSSTNILPEPHQVLFCTKDTTWNELELLLFRCFGSLSFSQTPQLFSIVHIELLVNELQFKLVEVLKNLEADTNYLLALICRGTSGHPFLSELSCFSGKSVLNLSDEELRQAFQNECHKVLTITSVVPGLGKTNRVKEYAFAEDRSLVRLHISGPFCKRNIIEKLSALNVGKHHVLHIDIGNTDNPAELDTFLFELIILRHVTAGFTSFSLETDCVFIEIANTINDSLRNSLNTAMYFKREHLVWKNYDDYLVSMEVNSPIQIVCQYLQSMAIGTLDKRDLIFKESQSVCPVGAETCKGLLREHFGTDNELSFTVVNIFLQILADQLKKMSCSTFLKVSRISDMVGQEKIPNIRSTLVNALKEASKEFSSRSIASCRSAQISTMGTDQETLENKHSGKVNTLKFAETMNQRVEGMIRWEDSNHLIFVFHCQNIQTLSPLYRDLQMVPSHIKALFESQLKRPMQDFARMDQSQLQMLLQRVARTNPVFISKEKQIKLSSEYALTPDNLLKMVLIMLRVKAGVPIIIMGETGCGKTSLIRYLATISDVTFEVLSIHAGIEEEEIISVIRNTNEQALSNPNRERWLFLDEINTSEHIGLISSAICSRVLLDKVLAPSVVVMGACNPYKLRTQSAVSNAGLTEKVRTDDLSKLVYRVLPLPERMVDYVWDFGSLSDKDEAVYIGKIMYDTFPQRSDFQRLLQELLSQSQKFVRKTEDVSYCVSLRDIQRCKTLIKWFLHYLPLKGDDCHGKELKSIILALSVCYHCRFSDSSQREKYRREIQQVCSAAGFAHVTEKCVQEIIIEEQRDFLKRMVLPDGTAKNTSLQENVFVILVCLLNRIPIFLVGKPGCSKSLSMQIIRSNLRGRDSKDEFLRQFPQLYCVSFQGSESSTSDGIIKVFEKAERYQKSNNKDDILSVVILDEIGLAEISKFNPLKVLHSLLEPDGHPQPNVAVVGISNWALDASKMNRGIHLSRPDMDEKELYQTGISISESFLESRQRNKTQLSSLLYPTVELNCIKDTLEGIANSYLKYTKSLRFRNFHGLRDYYALVKYVSRELIQAADQTSVVSEDETQHIILQGLQRNFGGLPSEFTTLINMFQIEVNKMDSADVLTLIKDNITDKMARHLMCITSGESVLSLIENVLKEIGREERVIIFGSHFEEDQTADYNYRILSRIILCMEQGFILILRDLENIYGSLYDMLNQNYTIIGKKKHCRVALGHYSNPICQVHDDFRCIVLVDEGKVDFSDPPFLNRFEKQFLKFTAIIDNDEKELITDLEIYVKTYCSTQGCHFDSFDCFPIYGQDLIPSLVISHCRDSHVGHELQQELLFEECVVKLLMIAQPDSILRLSRNISQDIRKKSEQVKEQYFRSPIHSGIWHFIECQINQSVNRDKCLTTIVLTNSSIHTQTVKKNLKYEVQVEKLGSFKSEKQLYLRLQHFWLYSPASILFVQCSAVEDEKHILLAKSTIENTRMNALKENSDIIKHVYIVLHIDRRRMKKIRALPVNFLSGWELVLLDSIEEPEIPLPLLCKMSLYDTVIKKKPLTKYISEELFWSFSTIRYQRYGRDIESIHKIIETIKTSDDLLQILQELICNWIVAEFDTLNNSNWLEQLAGNSYALNTSSSFVAAVEEEICTAIRTPLSKLIFRLENINALSSFFYDEHHNQRRDAWVKMVHDNSIFSITDLPPYLGPECYICTAADLEQRCPLSKIIYDKIQETKDDFMESYLFVKGKCDITDDDEMPEQVLEELISQHEIIVKDSLPDLTPFMYDSFVDDYFHDFSNIVSYASTSHIKEEIRLKIVQWTLSQKIQLHTDFPLELILKLHVTVWIFSSILSAELHLFDVCAEMLNAEENFAELMELFNLNSQQKDLSQSCVETFLDLQTETSGSLVGLRGDGFDFEKTFYREKSLLEENQVNITEHAVHFQQDEDDYVSSDRNNQNVSQKAFSKAHVFNPPASVTETPSTSIGEDLPREYSSVMKGSLLEGEGIIDVEQTVYAKQEGDDKSSSNNDLDNILEKIELEKSRPGLSHKVFEYGDSLYVAEENGLQFVPGEKIDAILYRDGDKKHSKDTVKRYESLQENADNVDSEKLNTVLSEPLTDERILKDRISRVKLVEFMSLKMIPTQTVMQLYSSTEDWNARVSTLLAHAMIISSEPRALHNLRLFQDLFCIFRFHLIDAKLKVIYRLASILQLDTEMRLDSSECFECILELLFGDPVSTVEHMQTVMAAYLNRCLAGDAETPAMLFFLRLLQDEHVKIESFMPLKPPFHLSINLEVADTEDDNESIYLKFVRDQDVDLDEHPFLCALDETLRYSQATGNFGSQLAVLIVDILEEYFAKLLAEKIESDLGAVKSDSLSAHKLILSCEYGIKWMTGVAYIKTFAGIFGHLLLEKDFDNTACSIFLPEIQAVLNKDENHAIPVSIRNLIVKSFGQDLLPWKLYKICEHMGEVIDSFRNLDWTDEYLNCCIEGNPLVLHAPEVSKNVADVLIVKDSKKKEDILREILSRSKDEAIALAIHGLVLSQFYIQRSYKQQDDSSNQTARLIEQIANEENMDNANLLLLTCLLGRTAFSCSYFELNEESSQEHCCIAFFGCSLYAVILASNQNTGHNSLSLLAKCLLCPSKIESHLLNLLRSMPQSKGKNMSLDGCVEFCPTCRHRVVQKKAEQDLSTCPICFGQLQASFVNGSKPPVKTEQSVEKCSFSLISAKLIRLFVDMCLLGSLALDFSTSEELETIPCMSETGDFQNSITDLFMEIKGVMDISCRDLYIFLQACLLHLKGLIRNDSDICASADQVIDFYMQFEKEVKPLAAERYAAISEMVKEHSVNTGISARATELCLYENDFDNQDIETKFHFFPAVFRLQGRASLRTLKYELDTLNIHSEDFPFLTFVLNSLPELALLGTIVPLIQWHLATVSHIGYRFKRQECLNMSVQDFIYHDENEKVRVMLQNRFENLQNALLRLIDSECKLAAPIRRVTNKTKMKDCLVLDSNSMLFKVVKELIDTQNRFLDMALLLSVRGNCQALSFLSRGDGSAAVPTCSVSEVNISSIICYEWDEELLSFSHAHLNYGFGKRVNYEFVAIEKSLALDLVVGKSYIILDSSLPSAVFVDEFYKGFSKLVKDVSELIPQRELSTDLVNAIKAKRNIHPRLTADLITHTGVLIALVRKTKGDPDQAIIEYVEKWRNYLTRSLPIELLPAPEDSVKLCHLVALYGLLEELNAESVIDCLSDKYRAPLTSEIETQLNGILHGKNHLEAENILKAAKRFIYRCLSTGEIDCSCILFEYLKDDTFWPFEFAEMRNKAEEKHPLYLIPRDLKVQHLHYMVSLMETKLKELTEKEIKLTHIASLRPSINVTKAGKKRKMAQKRRV